MKFRRAYPGPWKRGFALVPVRVSAAGDYVWLEVFEYRATSFTWSERRAIGSQQSWSE